MACVNLKERFGRQYRVRYEESYHAQYGPRAYTVDPWLMIIPCQHGHIYPQGGNMLASSTHKPGATAKRLKAIQGVTLHQDGADGVTVLFPVDHFDAVAEIMRPRRRRVVSESERERLRILGAKYGFQHGTGARFESAVCVPTPPDGSQAIQAPSVASMGLATAAQ
jgi:hypothetical protein